MGAVVHLAGAGIGDQRWSPARKQVILDSRTGGTGLLARTLAGLQRPPAVLVSASAVGYYGGRGDEELTEVNRPGEGFLAGVCEAWESATSPAADAGIRVATIRSGIVLAREGGALPRMVLPFRLGLGGRLATGEQWMSWIALADEVRAIVHILETPGVTGAVNLTAPNPVTNAEFTRILGRVLRRPTFLPTPLLALKAWYGGELVQSLLVEGQRVIPAVLDATGFAFEHQELEGALRAVLTKPAPSS
jgi:uncharacterized protein (TIGR01777 family)